MAPSPPTPLPRFTGARGGLVVSGQWSGELRAVWPHAKPRRREGNRRVWRSEQCDGLSFSPFHFLASTLYGMDAMAPSPPTPLPRFTGARGGLVFSCLEKSQQHVALRAGRAGAEEGGLARFCVQDSVSSRYGSSPIFSYCSRRCRSCFRRCLRCRRCMRSRKFWTRRKYLSHVRPSSP